MNELNLAALTTEARNPRTTHIDQLSTLGKKWMEEDLSRAPRVAQAAE